MYCLLIFQAEQTPLNKCMLGVVQSSGKHTALESIKRTSRPLTSLSEKGAGTKPGKSLVILS
jgi:hypothetical protein